jgi:hypothetical protein
VCVLGSCRTCFFLIFKNINTVLPPCVPLHSFAVYILALQSWAVSIIYVFGFNIIKVYALRIRCEQSIEHVRCSRSLQRWMLCAAVTCLPKKKRYTCPMYVTFSTTLWVLSTLSSALLVSVRGKLGVFLWGGAHVFFPRLRGVHGGCSRCPTY